MIPDAEALGRGLRFWTLRRGLPPVADAVVKTAREEAAALACDERSEPAAVFYAFARRPRGLSGGWRQLPVLLAMNQASSLGFELDTDALALADLVMAVVLREMDFEAVRAWFDQRLS